MCKKEDKQIVDAGVIIPNSIFLIGQGGTLSSDGTVQNLSSYSLQYFVKRMERVAQYVKCIGTGTRTGGVVSETCCIGCPGNKVDTRRLHH